MTSKRLARLAAGLALAALLLYVFFRGVDAEALLEVLKRAHPLPLGGVVLSSVATYAIRGWRWGDLLSPVVRVRYRHLVSATFVGFMAGLLIPRAGEVVRPYLIGRRYGVSVSAAFASIILERLVDLVTVLLLFALYLYVLPPPAAQVQGELMDLIKLGGGLTGLVALGVTGVLLAFHIHAERTVAFLDRLLFKLPERFAAPVSRALRAFAGGLGVLRASPLQLARIFLQSLALWLVIAAGAYWSFIAFDVELPFRATFLLLAFLTVGVAIPTPGMVGGFHEAYRLALTQVFGVAAGPAVAGGLAMHFLTNLPVLLIGLALLGSEGLTLGKVTEMSEKKP
jgi:hypothetical protein